MFCPKCGQPINPNAAFCTHCGAKNEPEQAEQQTYQATQDTYQSYEAPQNDYTYTPGPGFAKRDLVMAIVLSLVTCGIYGIYWFICLVNDLNAASGETSDQNGVTVWLLTLVTCGIYGIFWMYKAGNKMNTAKAMRGMATDPNAGIIYLILMFFGLGIVSYALIQNDLNKMADLG